MNEISLYEQVPAQVSVYSDTNLYMDFIKIAESLAKSELVPANYRNKPENCLLAIDMARQIGCKSPFFIMQNLNVIQGKPSWSGQFCAAIVRANFGNVHIEWKTDPAGCRVVGKDKNGNECLGTTVTMEMAEKEGWVNKNGSKWKTMPQLMLQYRAFTFFARIHCPEKLLGLYDEYETTDFMPARTSNTVELEKTLSDESVDAKSLNSEKEHV